jgi:tetratricopeptide (TPR) repeat protein
MSPLSPRRAILLAALAAATIYLPAVANRWALDDHGLIERNPAAHAIGAAWRAAFSPYWPPEGEFTAGLYRPLTTLSYALDWTVSGGKPGWFHFSNLLLHAAATALVVAVALQWLGPPGALLAGLVFAWHPAHVEAVANVVGRAEVLVAIGLLGAVLAARRYRRAAGRPAAAAWFALTLAAVMLALGSKEHGAVAPVLLILDQVLEPAPHRRRGTNLQLAVIGLTAAWLYLWRAVAGEAVGAGAVVYLKDLPAARRLAAMLPVYLEAVRLLVWPFRLAADYSPQTIPFVTNWSWVSALALATVAALVSLGLLAWRTAPAIAFAFVAALATYLPTSNLLFTSGVVLAERTLYLAVLAPALGAGWLLERLTPVARRQAVAAGAAALLLAFGWRTVSRIPFWRDTRSVVIEGLIEHPENFANQVRVAEAWLQAGDTSKALAHYLVAGELFDRYSFVPVRAARLAWALGRPRQAMALGRVAYRIAPGHPGTAELLVDLLLASGMKDSALALAREAVRLNPGNLAALRLYTSTLDRAAAPGWQAQLARARLDWLEGRLAAASARLDSASRVAWSPAGPAACFELTESKALLGALAPRLAERADAESRECNAASAMMSR